MKEEFMKYAIKISLQSKDNRCKVGACVVKNKKIVSTGINSMPYNILDEDYYWFPTKSGPICLNDSFLETKHAYVCHAELNAIINCERKDLIGAQLYTTLYPCYNCAKMIIQAGIKDVYYLYDYHSNHVLFKAAKKLFELTNINVEKIEMAMIDNDNQL